MAFEVFKPIFDIVDESTLTFMHDITTQCVVEITPILTVGLTLTFISYGFLLMRGASNLSMGAFLEKSFRIAVIVNIAMAGGLYQTELAELIHTLPNDLATALIANPAQKTTAASLIDEAAGVGFDCAADAFNKAGLLSLSGVTFCFIGLIVTLMTGILVAVGGAYLLLAKIALSVLIGLGPLFIIALIFPATKRFFTLWIGQVANYILLVVLYAAVFGLMMSIFKNYMVDTKLDGLKNVGYTVGGVCILSFSMLIILRQLPILASSLAGGVALNFSFGFRLPHRQLHSPSQGASTGVLSSPSIVQSSSDSAPPQTASTQNTSPLNLVSRGYYKGQALKTMKGDQKR